MISENDLQEAILDCQSEKNPTANTCIRLAAYYTILQNMNGEKSNSRFSGTDSIISYDSGTEFSNALKSMPINDVLMQVDDLLQTVYVTDSPLYRAFFRKLNQKNRGD